MPGMQNATTSDGDGAGSNVSSPSSQNAGRSAPGASERPTIHSKEKAPHSPKVTLGERVLFSSLCFLAKLVSS